MRFSFHGEHLLFCSHSVGHLLFRVGTSIGGMYSSRLFRAFGFESLLFFSRETVRDVPFHPTLPHPSLTITPAIQSGRFCLLDHGDDLVDPFSRRRLDVCRNDSGILDGDLVPLIAPLSPLTKIVFFIPMP